VPIVALLALASTLFIAFAVAKRRGPQRVLRRLRAASSESRAPHLFLLDELFRGTNAVERIAAGEAVLKHLILKDGTFKDHLVLAATHDGELVDFLRGSSVPYHFSDTVSGDGLSFDYRLTPGAATSRNAITLLKLHGAPESVVSSALNRAAALASKQRTMGDAARRVRLSSRAAPPAGRRARHDVTESTTREGRYRPARRQQP
jgi:DNA mismatch repair ATPase MutS